MAMSLKQLKSNYGRACSRNQLKINMAARTVTGGLQCRWHIKLRMHLHFSSTKVASYKNISIGKPPEDSEIVTILETKQFQINRKQHHRRSPKCNRLSVKLA